MPWTRRQFIDMAYEEIGLGGDYTLSPAELESARTRLDGMMATWNARGIRLGYPIGATPFDGDLDDVTNVPDAANEAIYLNLAVRLAPSFGRQIMPATAASAKTALDALSARVAYVPQRQMPAYSPSGAGNRWRGVGSPFLRRPSSSIDAGPDGPITFD